MTKALEHYADHAETCEQCTEYDKNYRAKLAEQALAETSLVDYPEEG
jgi:hypothetical protein